MYLYFESNEIRELENKFSILRLLSQMDFQCDVKASWEIQFNNVSCSWAKVHDKNKSKNMFWITDLIEDSQECRNATNYPSERIKLSYFRKLFQLLWQVLFQLNYPNRFCGLRFFTVFGFDWFGLRFSIGLVRFWSHPSQQY